MESRQVKNKKNKNLKNSLIVFGVVLLLATGLFFYQKKIMPDQLMNAGKKNFEVGSYDKALKSFSKAAKLKPYDDEPIYYQALTLSKMPSTYETQKMLHEIAQLEDCEEASALAEEALLKMRKGLELRVGSSYIDNVLYQDQLVRWNASEPITYSVTSNVYVPDFYIETVKKAFQNWQTATNGEISFREVNAGNAKINVKFVDAVSFVSNEEGQTGEVIPSIKDNKLLKMDINLKPTDKNKKNMDEGKLLSLAQHEIGHALGLWGHSASVEDVMYYSGDFVSDSTYAKKISTRDANTLMLVYKMVPDVIDTPIKESEYADLFYHNVLTTYPGKNYELEIQRLISQLRGDKNNIVVWVDLAINYAYNKQYPRSNYILNKVLPLVSNDFRNQHVILYNLAANYYKMKEYKTAEKYLNYATGIHDDIDTQILETFIDLKLGRTSIAKEKLMLLNKNYPENIEIALKLAEVHRMDKDKANEKLVIDRLIRNNSNALKDRRVAKLKKR